MSALFLDFFAKLQERQASITGPSGQPLQRGGASAAATAAAVAAPTSRPVSRRHHNDSITEQDGPGEWPYFEDYSIKGFFFFFSNFKIK